MRTIQAFRMEKNNHNILCVGNINLDEVIKLDDKLKPEMSAHSETSYEVGGGSANTSLVLNSCNNIGDVMLAGCVGNDSRGDIIVDTLEDRGVELVLPRYDNYPTSKIRAIVTDNKKPMYTHEDTDIPKFSVDDIKDRVWRKSDHLHITTFDKNIAFNFAKEANSRGLTISLNPSQGYANNSFSNIVELCDLIQMNRSESEIFRERNGPLSTVVSGQQPTDVVITHGPAGCTVHSEDGVFSHSGFPDYVDEVVDTIGAGDSFIAGLISMWLTDASLERCLEVANAYGAVSITKRGAPNNIDWTDVQDVINK